MRKKENKVVLIFVASQEKGLLDCCEAGSHFWGLDIVQGQDNSAKEAESPAWTLQADGQDELLLSHPVSETSAELQLRNTCL